MKRFAVLVLALLCLLGMIGCDRDDGTGVGVRETFPSLNMIALKSLVNIYGDHLTWELSFRASRGRISRPAVPVF